MKMDIGHILEGGCLASFVSYWPTSTGANPWSISASADGGCCPGCHFCVSLLH